jgi:hypothetical protein
MGLGAARKYFLPMRSSVSRRLNEGVIVWVA